MMVIACVKRDAFAQGSNATTRLRYASPGISLPKRMSAEAEAIQFDDNKTFWIASSLALLAMTTLQGEYRYRCDIRNRVSFGER
jgi:hypothetical protein